MKINYPVRLSNVKSMVVGNICLNNFNYSWTLMAFSIESYVLTPHRKMALSKVNIEMSIKHKHRQIPATYWLDAFLNIIFLINRLPTPILDNHLLFFTLCGKQPDYTILRYFGCVCYSFLCPYASHKFIFRSKMSFFLDIAQISVVTCAYILFLRESLSLSMWYLMSTHFLQKKDCHSLLLQRCLFLHVLIFHLSPHLILLYLLLMFLYPSMFLIFQLS